ncbi:SRPBCC family protein [Streptomyces sp. NPDC003781]|uniref:SRPBCC family protein n=1 Tax=Streptomyces sp. NPDC003781 TaxID=3364686 RepID=UPI0036795CB2
MATFSLERTTPLPPDEAWRRLTRWERHGDTVPLTRVTAGPPGPTRRGTVVVARTGAGVLAIADPMEVTVWQPPRADLAGRCRMDKRGRVVRGWAEIEVGTGPDGRTRVVWREELDVRLVPAFLDGLLARSGRLVFGRTVDHLLRRA